VLPLYLFTWLTVTPKAHVQKKASLVKAINPIKTTPVKVKATLVNAKGRP
jgi:hypothetical protein